MPSSFLMAGHQFYSIMAISVLLPPFLPELFSGVAKLVRTKLVRRQRLGGGSPPIVTASIVIPLLLLLLRQESAAGLFRQA